MTRAMTRAAAIRTIAFGGLVSLGLVGSSFVRRLVATANGAVRVTPNSSIPALHPIGMMGTQVDMSAYMELFDRHTEIRRTVELIPGGVRTTTESHAPELVAQLQEHVVSMYAHLERGAEVTCMSDSLPTLFRNATSYRRQLTTTPHGVVVTETSTDPRLVSAARAHAREVTGFVRDGMAAMMQGMGGNG